MVGGIDGLLGGLSIVTFTSIAIILNLQGNHSLTQLCLVIVVATLFKHPRKTQMVISKNFQ